MYDNRILRLEALRLLKEMLLEAEQERFFRAEVKAGDQTKDVPETKPFREKAPLTNCWCGDPQSQVVFYELAKMKRQEPWDGIDLFNKVSFIFYEAGKILQEARGSMHTSPIFYNDTDLKIGLAKTAAFCIRLLEEL
jgi:hypothetical protein